MSTETDNRFMRRGAVMEAIGLQSSAFHALRKNDPTFPKPFRFGASDASRPVWRCCEIDAWIESKRERADG